jgi:predicted phage terminase large subunit-like protein
MIAVGVGGAVTGWRADLAICDDPIADREQADSAAYRERAWRWWQEAFLTRLQPRAGVVLLHTRWHPDDVIGRVLNSPGADKWAVLTLPAICEEADDPLGRAVGESLWPEMFSADDLEAKRLDVGERAWAALYEQRPTPQQGALFRRDWLEGRYARLPEDGLRIVTAVDASFGEGVQSDYSAVVTIAADKTHYYVLHALRGRWHFADLLEQIRRVHCVYGAEAIVVEDTGAGRSALQELRRQSDLPVVGVRPEGSKIARAESVAPLLEGGRVLFPESSPRWRDELIEELASFPQVKHDDLTDAFVYALRRLRERLHSGGIGIAGVIHHTARNEEEPFIDPRVVGAAERGSNLAAAAPTAAVASRPTLKGECRWCGITNTDAPGRIGRNSIVCHRCMRPENRPSGGHTETLAAATHA